jgi:NAD(P)H-hydrate epimerase
MTPTERAAATDEQIDVSGLERSLRHPRALFSFAMSWLTGLVTLFTHEPVYGPVASQLQAVMVHPWKRETKLAGNFDAMLIGPGLASPDLPDEMKQLARDWWQNRPVPVIADASALDWLAQDSPTPKHAIRVLTPHPGEAGRLLKMTAAQVQANRPAALRKLSQKFGNCFVVLKGHQTLVGRSDGGIFVNSSGNPHLAQGGAGDVLGGLLAGLLAQPALQSDALKTVCHGVWRHGAAADSLQAARSNWWVEDLVEVC